MDIKKLKRLLVFLTTVLIVLSGVYYKYIYENKAQRFYRQGLNLYQEKKFSDAYYNFKQIKFISRLYELSLLKQYQCAINLDDKKTAQIKLKELIKITKNENIKPWAMYWEASLASELKLNNESQSARKFKYIQEKYPHSDFGIASAYKSAQLSKESPYSAKESYIKYLSYAPNGKFAYSAINELKELENLFTKEDYKIVADAKLANEKYLSALEYYQKGVFSENWYNISKCYKGLNNKEQEKLTLLKGIELNSSTVSEKDVNNAIDRLIAISGANKIQVLQDLYSKYPKAHSHPTIIFKLAEASNSIRAIKLYESISNDYPNSIWASNALWEIFWDNYQESRFKTCEKLAKKHISLYHQTQDSPRIAYWYGKTLLKNRKNQQAREVFYDVIHEFPLSYYAFLSARQLKASKANKMIVKKPITNYDRKNLNKIIFKDKTLLELANTNDWELIDDLKIDDEFIKSWVTYQKENYPMAINIARDEVIKINEIKSKENEYITFSDQMLKMIYPIFHENIINEYAHLYKQSPYLFLSLVREESHFNKNAKSSAGAVGLSQLMQPTASFIEKKPVSKETLLDEKENIRIGLKYFTYLMNNFKGNEYLAILAYNAGPGSVNKWLNDSKIKSDEIDIFVENIPYLETKNYIKKIISSYWVYLNIYSAKNK